MRAAKCARISSRRPAVIPCGVTSTRPNANGSGRPRSRRSCERAGQLMTHRPPEDGQPPTMTEGAADTTEGTTDASTATQPDIHPAADDSHALLSVNRVQKYFRIKQGILFQRQVG